jgi:ferredoxin
LATGGCNSDDDTVTSVTASGAPKQSWASNVSEMRVWIDQDLCTGDGLCVDHAGDVFVQLEDGIAYVSEFGAVLNDPGGSGSVAWVTVRDEQAVIDAAIDCPGECIFIEMERVSAA